MKAFPELDTIRVHVDETTRERHMAAIGVELRQARKPEGRRFRLLAIATALFLLLPVIALAAERAQPGDFLYPVRQLVQGPQPEAEVDSRFFPQGPVSNPAADSVTPATTVPEPEPDRSDAIQPRVPTTEPPRETPNTPRGDVPDRSDEPTRAPEQEADDAPQPDAGDERRRSDGR